MKPQSEWAFALWNGRPAIWSEVAAFSSHYPHFEGNPDPLAHYERELADLSPVVQAQFLGGNVETSYALAGDPL